MILLLLFDKYLFCGVVQLIVFDRFWRAYLRRSPIDRVNFALRQFCEISFPLLRKLRTFQIERQFSRFRMYI